MNLTARKFNSYMGAEAASALNGNSRSWFAGCCCCCCSAMCEIAEYQTEGESYARSRATAYFARDKGN